jgi:prevent-host-death family protein
MKVTASTLRQNIYKLLDQVLETGSPIEIERKGKKLKIVPVKPEGKLAHLDGPDIMKCDPEDLVHIDWSSEWKI